MASAYRSLALPLSAPCRSTQHHSIKRDSTPRLNDSVSRKHVRLRPSADGYVHLAHVFLTETRRTAPGPSGDFAAPSSSANLPNPTALKTASPALLLSSSPPLSCLALAHPTCAQQSLP